MSSVDDSGPELGGDDLVAAEYVLGALSDQDRAAAASRLDTDAAFARTVDRWEAWFAPIAASGYSPVEPPVSLKAMIDRRIFAGSAAPRPSFWGSVGVWRAIAALAVAALVLWIAVPVLLPGPADQPSRLVASLSADGSDVRYLALYDGASGEVALTRVSGERGEGRDFELWMIEGKAAPVSMGVVPPGDSTRLPVEPDIRAKLDAGAVLAISMEPKGGSPTGQPTGPVVAAGDLKTI